MLISLIIRDRNYPIAKPSPRKTFLYIVSCIGCIMHTTVNVWRNFRSSKGNFIKQFGMVIQKAVPNHSINTLYNIDLLVKVNKRVQKP